ncbi:PBP1A family penicillin-binding protein [Roseobacter sp. HKCCD9010]|uniref:penicillin-binding protein 1A n=1 Tax=unclassified Roseobacter TaxID=196798 RepID=UPI001492FDFB|nr:MULTISPECIES: penicillin-binding protein 1A [unclassified Roseobacter]MBF9050710.1 PBP1A family penicillin-binding protein [Rhodobacterales bacterium HKCCD4356]NNV11872.1 PBP1A family penicillin-binding protein [Roseobacter sp. HKCCD7357]NNV18023.1 PBP1A family penicillin-binding protein [Roseobacter sp. HKCCD8768]NNV26114.1 PBP1A family penicillin-binding protein [Roseobacter sp. HKCCD8192]NNV31750.1 PBP1A family penicillin-binding protein [Roseobacter sp. HKCCD9061]
MFRFILGIFGAIFSWLTIGLVFTAFSIGAVLYMYSRDLPDHETLAQYTPATISRIYSAEGEIVDEFARERRLFVAAEDIPDRVSQAFVSAEDRNFYEHEGYDPRAIGAAIVEAVRSRGRDVRGASTITQQVMKNFLLDGSRTIERKVQEIILAARIEQTLTKDRILELYLNEIFLGQNSYGVAAAAQTYFNADLSELTLQQAAYLAALPQAPSNFHPVRDYERAVNRRNYVLREMYENGYISREEMETAQATPLETVQGGHIEPFRAAVPPRNYFTDEIRRQLSVEFGEEEFFSGGYAVRATMDESLQEAAEVALRRGLESYDRSRGLWREPLAVIDPAVLDGADEETWRAALADVEFPRDIDGWHAAVVLSVGERSARIGIEDVPEDEDGHFIPAEDVTWARPVDAEGNRGSSARVAGDLLDVGDVIHVRAMNRDSDGSFIRWTLRQIPEVQGGLMAMDVNTGRVLAMQGGFSYQYSVFNRATQATRQPGSSFKPFVYAAALDSGYSPNTIVIDAPIEIDTGAGVWRPTNASNQFYGPAPLRTGIVRSRNLMTIRLAQDVGMETVARYSERFGVYDEAQAFLANSLGSQETTLYRMVAAYAMFANGGERVEPTLVDRVQDRFGGTVYRHDQRLCPDCELASLEPGVAPRIVSNRERVIDPITAYQVTSMMRGVVQRGTAASTVNLPVPIAGKTGTTNDERDAWFVGYSSNIVAGCYIGFDTPRPMGGGNGGGRLCGPVFNEFMQAAVEEYGGGPFRVPEGGVFYNIDRFSGQRLPADASGDHVVAELFREGEEPIYGLLAVVDGGFAMGSNLPMFGRGEEEGAGATAGQTVTTSTGDTARVPTGTGFGTLSSGGLY